MVRKFWANWIFWLALKYDGWGENGRKTNALMWTFKLFWHWYSIPIGSGPKALNSNTLIVVFDGQWCHHPGYFLQNFTISPKFDTTKENSRKANHKYDIIVLPLKLTWRFKSMTFEDLVCFFNCCHNFEIGRGNLNVTPQGFWWWDPRCGVSQGQRWISLPFLDVWLQF